MANKRVFEAQPLTQNGVAIGGVAQIVLSAGQQTAVVSNPDGAEMAEDVDVIDLGASYTMECSDLAKVNALLAAADGDAVFQGKESGTQTFQNTTIGGGGGDIIITGADVTIPRNADGSLRISGVCRFADGAKTLSDLITLLGGQVAGTLTYPERLYRVHSVSFDPDGAPGAILPIHAESVGFSISAQALQSAGDDDIGMTADKFGYGVLNVTLTHRDRGIVTGSDISAQLLGAGRGVLTAELSGRGGAADKTLTVNNLVWQAADETKGKDYWTFALRGIAGSRLAGGAAKKLYDAAVPANQLFWIG